MKTTWNLGLLYKDHNDPRIEKDVRSAEKDFAAFEKAYKGKTDYLKNEGKLLKALQDFESLFSERSFTKSITYFNFLTDLDSKDSVARAKSTQFIERLTKIEHKIMFFELSLAKIPAPLQKKFISSKKLAPFAYYLKTVFNKAKHDLSEAEEKIMSIKSLPAYSHWLDATEKLLAKSSVSFQGRDMPIPEAVNKIGDLPTAERRELHASLMKVLESHSDVAESEINAIVTNKKIDDELRGFVEPYDATILGYQNERKSVLALVAAVTDNFRISHRFLALKAKLLKLPHLEYSDRNIGIGENVKKIPFAESVEMLRKVFRDVDPEFEAILNRFLENGQIDVFPRQGKTGGAYCHSDKNRPTFVLLNDTETFDSASTFAHEMGHAIHSELSKVQPVMYQDYSMSSAEVASTLFEAILFDAVYETLSEKEKIVALHTKINDDIQTIFRQIACFNFETEMHKTIRAKGGMSKEELAALMNKHMSSYLGPITHMKDIDGYYFVQWGHIRRFFYVYSYAFGQLISKALYAKYKEDKKFIGKIKQFLSAGGSDSPENIFKSIGIDVTKPDFWKKGLESISKDIDKLEKLTKNR
ncbi:MAG TPA: M3 family oligoendopeptidase [Candidatus Paceibacterota bacterium]